ncbi:MAG: CRISPR-associated helicase Cas3' [Lachnospiraceae bacterium]|nr:CRISPR-associated helicase Cas3' [Lachnospiraceae bacterium]
MDFIAHKREDGMVQSVKEHLAGTAELAANFASDFGAEEQGRLIGFAHDIGKYSKEFQKRICDDGPKVDHSSAGALLCTQKNNIIASFCIAGHHSGLPDYGGEDDDSEATLCARMKRALNKKIPDFSAWKEEIGELPNAGIMFPNDDTNMENVFFTRMLFSCLVDADYLDTERFMSNDSVDRGSGNDMEFLEKKLDTYISGWFPPEGELNRKRCEILNSCIEKHTCEPGLFSLTVPTGGGKTVSSLAFAIKHARAKGLKRIIYVIPYTSIIEQTAEIFRKILGNDNVLEHHSNIGYDLEENISQENVKMSLAAENWDMPVIVTTSVQFFESLFANKSSKCRKLHNIAKSVIIFDEAQMIPVSYLKPCIYTISQLVKNYNVSAVLCTATQPSLDNIFEEFIGDYHPTELCPKELYEDPIFIRTRFKNIGVMTKDEVADYMMNKNQILCIVNSRKSASDLFTRLCEDGRFHLSTLMTPTDRKKTLYEIRKRLKDGRTCRVVATSLIEAGVDVDFPVVMREEAGLDSMLQAAGRCNREGHREKSESEVIIYKSEDKPPNMFALNISAGRIAIEGENDIVSSKCIKKYFDTLYKLKGEETLDSKKIMQLIRSDYCFKKIADRFKMIDNDTETVYIPVGDGKELVERRKYGELSKSLLRKLGQYGVNIYKDHLKKMYETGDVEKVGDSEWVLSNIALYNEKMGLSFNAEVGKAYFV